MKLFIVLVVFLGLFLGLSGWQYSQVREADARAAGYKAAQEKYTQKASPNTARIVKNYCEGKNDPDDYAENVYWRGQVIPGSLIVKSNEVYATKGYHCDSLQFLGTVDGDDIFSMALNGHESWYIFTIVGGKVEAIQ